jgi:hypothetical protein
MGLSPNIADKADGRQIKIDDKTDVCRYLVVVLQKIKSHYPDSGLTGMRDSSFFQHRTMTFGSPKPIITGERYDSLS